MVYNFGAGPAVVPAVVLKKVQEEFCDWNGTGSSIVELSHRLPAMIEIGSQLEQKLRYVLQIPDDFAVLFLHGGARGQFAGIPLNLLGNKDTAAYALTGYWSTVAAEEARKYCKVNISTNTEYTIAPLDTWQLSGNEAFLHYTDNESISGVEYNVVPKFGNIPSVCDMTSSLLSKQLDFNQLDLVYASAQKNLGIAGLTVVIVRKNLLGYSHPFTPSILDYKIALDKKSMYNTPSMMSWYIADLILDWVGDNGGLAAIEQLNHIKAQLIYNVIDNNAIYSSKIDKAYRSRLNITFNLPTKELESIFLQESDNVGLKYLKGHSVLGGMRASCYNGMTLEGCQALASFMQVFADKHLKKS